MKCSIIMDHFKQLKINIRNTCRTILFFWKAQSVLQCIRITRLVLIILIGVLINAVRIFWGEFCKNTSIHGFRYFTDRLLHWSERCWWLVSFGVAILLCSLMIHDIWIDWNENPMSTNTDEARHISLIPFPTVTICPPIKTLKNKFDLDSVYDRFKLTKNLTDNELRLLNVLMQYPCPFILNTFPQHDKFVNESIYDIIEDIAPDLDYVMHECRWQQTKIACSDYFAPVFTEDGLCFSFNVLNFRDMYTDDTASRTFSATKSPRVSGWSLEKGYSNIDSKKEYPHRAMGSGPQHGLELILSLNQRDYSEVCEGEIKQQYSVHLQSPGKRPRLFYKVALGEHIILKIKPELTDISEGLVSYEQKHRECVHPIENPLRFFKMYSMDHSAEECWAKNIKQECGCVQVTMPRDKNTKICGAASSTCIKNAEKKIANISTYVSDGCRNNFPSCVEIDYGAKMTIFPFDITKEGVSGGIRTNDTGQVYAKVSIFISNDIQHIKVKKRVETYTVTDFLAICGGLLGLFLGVSLLSIVEIPYYAIIRVFWIIYRPRPPETEQPPEREEKHHPWVKILLRHIPRPIRIFFKEFCLNSNIHGLRYFAERDLHWSERSLWLISVMVSLCLCGLMIQWNWIKWQSNPVKTKIIDSPVDRIPFPTVTFCRDTKTRKDRLDITSALNSLSNLTETQKNRLNAVSQICPWLLDQIGSRDNFTKETIYDTIQYIAPDKYCMHGCEWLNPVLTEEGLCLSYNILSSDEVYTDQMASGMMIFKLKWNSSSYWNLESGYSNLENAANYPLQSNHKGRTFSITNDFMLFKDNDEYGCGFDQSLKIIVTPPGETVKVSRNYIRLARSGSFIFVIKPTMTITSNELRNFKPNQRRCFYQSENRLRFFKIYTELNCEDECSANFIRSECGCVKFSMPRDKSTKICGTGKIDCMKAAQRKLFTTPNGKAFRNECNCLPACTRIKYEMQYTRFKFNATYYLRSRGINQTNKTAVIGTVGVRTKFVEVAHRDEIMTSVGFVAFCGGLLGLILGISVLSIIEFVFYSTLRLFWRIRQLRAENVVIPVHTRVITVAQVDEESV